MRLCTNSTVTRKFLDWKFLFESSQTKIAWKLIPWPENCWLRKFRDCNFLACKFLGPKIPCTENSLKAPWDENSLTRAKGYNWLNRAATVPERIALNISNIYRILPNINRGFYFFTHFFCHVRFLNESGFYLFFSILQPKKTLPQFLPTEKTVAPKQCYNSRCWFVMQERHFNASCKGKNPSFCCWATSTIYTNFFL